MITFKTFLEARGRKGRKQISTDLKAAGYKELGAGADAIVWAKEKGDVVKIIMPDFGLDFDNAVLMIRKFYDFCKKENSIHLPRFTNFVTREIEEFDLDGDKVLLVSMERLKPLKEGSDEECFYWLLNELIQRYSNVSKAHDDLINNKNQVLNEFDFDEYAARGYKYFERMKDRSWILDFMKIMRKAYDYGKSQKFSWDLHTQNIMKRGSVPVIIDPWLNIDE
jgi:hypothetical protein